MRSSPHEFATTNVGPLANSLELPVVGPRLPDEGAGRPHAGHNGLPCLRGFLSGGGSPNPLAMTFRGNASSFPSLVCSRTPLPGLGSGGGPFLIWGSAILESRADAARPLEELRKTPPRDFDTAPGAPEVSPRRCRHGDEVAAIVHRRSVGCVHLVLHGLPKDAQSRGLEDREPMRLSRLRVDVERGRPEPLWEPTPPHSELHQDYRWQCLLRLLTRLSSPGCKVRPEELPHQPRIEQLGPLPEPDQNRAA